MQGREKSVDKADIINAFYFTYIETEILIRLTEKSLSADKSMLSVGQREM
uniref:Uncharacterized protein n=1 Tax=Arion vulgaris TaxID=1028688 RepID=A0A0B7BV64_9EUPU